MLNCASVLSRARRLKWLDGGEKASGVAAGVGDALCLLNGGSLARLQLRHAIHPIGIDAMGAAGIKKSNGGISQGDSFPCGIVGQTQDHQIRRSDDVLFGFWVLALGRVNFKQFNVLAGTEPIMNLQSGCSRLTVNKYLVQLGNLFQSGDFTRSRVCSFKKSGRQDFRKKVCYLFHFFQADLMSHRVVVPPDIKAKLHKIFPRGGQHA